MENTEGGTALFDLDGSLANYDKAMLRDLESIMSPQDKEHLYHLEPLNKLYLGKLGVTLEYAYHNMNLPWIKNRTKLISKTSGWWENLEPIESGFKIMKLAADIGFDIHILTQASTKKSYSWKEKINWCEEHIKIPHKITITEDKGMVYGKVLFDDWPNYIKSWLKWRPRGLVIMPVHPNLAQKEFSHPNMIRWDGTDKSFEEIKKALLLVYKRKSLEELIL